ncbi:hypothetical protein IG631_13488 [Alternaria alternata]|nr:hypothetical protein IG631_13488 [Alternaria alternata]
MPQPPQDPGALFAALAGVGQHNGQTNPPPAAASPFPFQQNMVPPPPPGFMPPPPTGVIGQPNMPVPPAGTNEIVTQILKAMTAGSIPPDQAIQALNTLAMAQNGGMPMPPPAVAQTSQVQPAVQNGNQGDSYDLNDTRMRDRSRSPDYQRRRSPVRSPPNPNRRESPTYGVYDPNAGPEGNAQRFERGERGRGRGKQRGGRNDRNEYRQRSPPRRQPSPPRAAYGQSKYIEWDETLPRDHIRVLSRTLFVGGAGGTEGEIRSIFARFGRVQTCIVNQDKRHAFVKMLTRPDAVAAKQGMDTLQDPAAQSKARQPARGDSLSTRVFLAFVLYEYVVSIIGTAVKHIHGGPLAFPVQEHCKALRLRLRLRLPVFQSSTGTVGAKISQRFPKSTSQVYQYVNLHSRFDVISLVSLVYPPWLLAL